MCSVQDPLTLDVVAEVVSAERFSYARMAVIALQNSDGEDEDAIILLGDEVLLTCTVLLNCVLNSIHSNLLRMCINIGGAPAPRKSS
jgi:hypothetical protein